MPAATALFRVPSRARRVLSSYVGLQHQQRPENHSGDELV